MKWALIHPTTVQCVDHWQDGVAIMVNIPNSARVCQVVDTPFDVASPCEWKECSDTVVADRHYYNTATTSFAAIVNAEQP